MYDQDESGRTAAGAGHGEHEDADIVLASGTVRLRDGHGDSAGTGFLVGNGLVLTCAHVVCDALGRPRDTEVPAGARVALDLPLLAGPGVPGHDIEAEVAHWVPIREDRSGDVAVLRLLAPAPGARPLPTSLSRRLWEHGSRIVGFTEASDRPVWQRGSLLGPAGKGWVQLSRADGQTVRVTGGFSGSPVWDNALGAVVGMIVAAEPVRDDQQAYMLHLGALADEIPALAGTFLAPAPFRGLEPFREEDADVFFGREEDTETVVRALRGDHAAVTLCGPSGCGKSSLALAGVAPVMRRAGHEVVVVDCGRTSRPVGALAVELLELARQERFGSSRAIGVERVVTWLTGTGLADTVHRLTGSATIDLLVVLDQAETLLDLPEGDLAALLSVLFPARRTAGMRVLLTLRADFIDAVLSHEYLGPVLKRGTVLPLTPMTRKQLHAVITCPVDRVPGVSYEPGLAHRILEDAGSEPGALPLLSFVLRHLWEEQSGGRLRVDAYERVGGVSGALRRHAEEAWRKYVPSVTETGSPVSADTPETPDPMEAITHARRLLAGLVRVVPGSGAPALRRVLTRAEAGEQRWRLAVLFAGKDERLLVLHGGAGVPESVELAHEALITAWPTLSEVVREDRDFLAARTELQHDRERWEREGCADELLPRGAHLASLESRLAGRTDELTAAETDFLDLADRQRHALEQLRRVRQRRNRWAWAAGSLALVLIATLGVFFVQETRTSREQAAEGRSRTLAVQADELAGTNPVQAALAAIAGYDTSPTQEARNALMRRYSEMMKASWVLSGMDSDIDQASMSADGKVTLVTTVGGRATLFLRSDDGRVRQENLRLGRKVRNPQVSGDGRRIAYLREGDALLAWHEVTTSGKHLAGPAHLLRHAQARNKEGAILAVKRSRFSPDSRFLVEASQVSEGLPLLVWDLSSGRPHEVPGPITDVRWIWFGADSGTLVAWKGLAFESGGGERSSLLAIDVATGSVRELAHDFYSIPEVSWDGRTAVVCQKKGENVRLYQAIRVSDGRILRSQGLKRSSCQKPEFDTTSGYFVVQGADSGDWSRIAIHGDAAPERLVPRRRLSTSIGVERLPLLMSGSETVMPFAEGRTVTGVSMSVGPSRPAHGYPVLLGDGDRMLARSDGGKALRIVETRPGARTLARAGTPGTPPTEEQPLVTDKEETLVADVSDHNRITVRALPSLRRLSRFAVSTPPLDEATGEPGTIDIMFRSDDRVVTLSGSVLEYWDARQGRRLSSAVKLPSLGLSSAEAPFFTMGAHPDPAYVTVSVQGEPDLHTIDLRTGREDRKQRIRLAEDLLTAEYLPDTRYMAVLTTGRIVELWSVEKGSPPRKVLGPFGPLEPHRWSMGSSGGSGFFLAYESTMVRLRADDPEHRDTFVFSKIQRFLGSTKDGRTLLSMPVEGDLDDPSSPGNTLTLFRIDPTLWKEHLCGVVGRELTADERTALSGELPERSCPDPAQD
ncbi:MAG TPA: trypsin-like peptidase domain-containing protein [Streptomyces sp.]|uniref:nSTAND1 domain-containing NTPase n=1 Tax=Streptomyces sp. TaxID=1931 RepID=UPI002BD45430|nr:trypsin-like peptidase domain-containing protein [Streptomyces sp.]HWU10771.1 trypsin-like peptidase domain-containing protein [Streptomyces sp.]